jgi:hypothetical protein
MNVAASMRDYLSDGGATEYDIGRFVEFIDVFEDLGKEGRYEVYRLWSRLLSNLRTPYIRHQVFDFSIELKDYLRVVVAGNIVDAAAPGNPVLVAAENFV